MLRFALSCGYTAGNKKVFPPLKLKLAKINNWPITSQL